MWGGGWGLNPFKEFLDFYREIISSFALPNY